MEIILKLEQESIALTYKRVFTVLKCTHIYIECLEQEMSTEVNGFLD